MSFNENLLRMLELRSMTVVELSRASGISRSVIYDLLKGKHPNKRLSVVKRIAKELGCTPGWLLRE